MRRRSYASAAGAREREHIRPGADAERADTLDASYPALAGAGRRPRLRRVGAAPETPADAEDVDERRRSASEGDAALLIAVPGDADLANRQARAIGEREHLDVEREAVDRQVRTDRARPRSALSSLKPHCVSLMPLTMKARTNQLKNAPDEVTDPGLVEPPGAGRLARSDHQRRARRPGVLEKARQVVGRRRQVGVGDEAPLAAGVEQSAA